jgi:hypothetical protein
LAAFVTRIRDALGTTEVVPFPVVALLKPQRDGVVDLKAPRGLKPAALLVTVDAGLEGLLHPRF